MPEKRVIKVCTQCHAEGDMEPTDGGKCPICRRGILVNKEVE